MTPFVSSLPMLDPKDRRLDQSPHDPAIAKTGTVSAAIASLRREPRLDCGLDTQLLFGDSVKILSAAGEWLRVQAQRDNYVGWTQSDAVTERPMTPTHLVCAPRSFVYPGPDLRFPASESLSMGSAVEVTGTSQTRGTDYALLAGGEAMIAGHLRAIDTPDTDPVEVASRLLGTPYLWGGNSAFGIDCSGLVQLAFRMCGTDVLRDSDMQAATLGSEIDPGLDHTGLVRGDLIFWKGHVAMVEGDGSILHASGHAMLVIREDLGQAIERIARLYAKPIGYRRP